MSASQPVEADVYSTFAVLRTWKLTLRIACVVLRFVQLLRSRQVEYSNMPPTLTVVGGDAESGKTDRETQALSGAEKGSPDSRYTLERNVFGLPKSEGLC